MPGSLPDSGENSLMDLVTRRFPFLCLIAAAFLVPEQGTAAEDGRVHDLLILPQAGERFQHVQFSCWIPDGVTPLQGVLIHQHG